LCFIIRQTETDVLQLLLCILDTIVLKFAIGLHKLVAMTFAVSFEIIIQRTMGNEPYYLMKNTLITTVLYNRSRKNTLQNTLIYILDFCIFFIKIERKVS
jgi:hypothetical protein